MTPILTATRLTSAPHRLHNLRPVGGYATRDGSAFVRDDLLWRSAAPLTMREEGSLAIAELGLHTIVDLRDSSEQRRTPGAWEHTALTVCSMPVFDDQLHDIHFDELSDLYRIMVGSFGAQLAAAFSAITANAARGVLFHCTAGKDRTGVLSALVLEVLGVDRTTILADFSLSQERLGDDYLIDLFAGIDVDSLPGIAAHRATASPPELLADTLAYLDREFGGSTGFLLAHGATEDDFARLRAAMLV